MRLDPAVVHEVADLGLAGDRDEIGQQPPVAAPPQRFGAHHDYPSGPGVGAVSGLPGVGFLKEHPPTLWPQAGEKANRAGRPVGTGTMEA